jgi:hypothetical protein
MPPRTEKPKAITLADLSDEDRKALLEQAREESRHNPRDVEGYDELTDRERAFRELMDGRDHVKGCPVQEGARLGRIEGFEARKPPNPAIGEPERILGVLRCIDCGGSSVLDTPLEEAVERAIEGLPEPAGVAAGGDGDDPDETDL